MIYSKKEGFSLIEVMIAVFVLSVGILTVLVFFPFGLQMARYSKMTSQAVQLAQEKIEEVISRPYTDVVSEPESVLAVPFNAYFRKTDVVCFDPNGSSSPNCPETGIKEVKVTVSWSSPFGGTSPKIELYTLISQR